MDISSFLLGTILAFARISSFLFYLPFLKGSYIPGLVKVSISLSLAIMVGNQMGEIEVMNLPHFFFLITIQVMIGLSLSYMVDTMMTAASMAGGLLDLDLGFSSAQLMDPSSGRSNTVLANIFSMLFTIVFLAAGGLNQLVYGIMFSFKFATTDFFLGDGNFLQMIAMTVGYMMIAGLQIAIPISLSMFVLNFIMLVLSKTSPQLNIFANAFAVKIALGLLFLYVAFPLIHDIFYQINEGLIERFFEGVSVIFQSEK